MVVLVILLAVLLLAAGITALAFYLGRRSSLGRGRTMILCAGIAACIVAGGIVLDYSGVYYVRPLVWWIVLVALAAAAVTLVVLVARGAVSGIGRALALTGVVVLSVVLAMGLIGVNELFEITPYPWEARARQVGEEAGFTPLLAGGRLPDTSGTERVGVLGGADPGIILSYGGYQVLERKAAEAMDEAAMRAVAAVGKDPIQFAAGITPGARYKMVRVGETPALLVQWQPVIPGGDYMTDTITLLLFKAGDTDVRMWSSRTTKPSVGQYREGGPGPEGLIAAAESLQPLD